MANEIERLTDEERADLAALANDESAVTLFTFQAETLAKALRIIDALTAALEAAQDPDEWRAECQYFMTLFYSEKSRAEALQARVTELEAERRSANTLLEQVLKCSDPEEELPFEGIQNHLSGQEPTTRAAESELAQMRGRVERALEWTDDSEKLTCEALAYHVAEALRGR